MCVCVQFDSGLYTTAVFIDSAYKLAAAATSTAPLTEVSKSIDRFAVGLLVTNHALDW